MSFGQHSCPACGSTELVTAYDLMRNVHVLRCRECGECYAISDSDLRDLGEEAVFSEWKSNYESQRRLA